MIIQIRDYEKKSRMWINAIETDYIRIHTKNGDYDIRHKNDNELEITKTNFTRDTITIKPCVSNCIIIE